MHVLLFNINSQVVEVMALMSQACQEQTWPTAKIKMDRQRGVTVSFLPIDDAGIEWLCVLASERIDVLSDPMSLMRMRFRGDIAALAYSVMT